jgi:WD40 repeat protein
LTALIVPLTALRASLWSLPRSAERSSATSTGTESRRTRSGAGARSRKSNPAGKTLPSLRAELLTVDGLHPAGSIAQHPFALSQLAHSPDGRTLATASSSDDDFVRLWDTRTKALIAEVRAQGNAVEALQFSPDGRTLATAAGDWTVALWHLDPDDAVRRLCAVVVPAAHTDNVGVPELCR